MRDAGLRSGADDETPLKPVALYFNVVVWGEAYRHYLLRYLLPSLLSPGNIPALTNPGASRFLIATTREDWAFIAAEPVFAALTGIIEVNHHEIPTPTDEDNKYLVMSSGHRWASERAFKDRAYGVFVTPDLMLSDGSVVALERHARAGKNVVLCAAIRFSTERLLPDIERRYRTTDEAPLVLDPRGLSELALRHKHPETLRYDYDSAWLADMPWTLYWDAPDRSGILLHTFSWAPLLVNYAAIEEHDTETFKKWTLDGDYIYRNFWGRDGIHVVQDSDEILLVSFTPHDDLPNVPFDPSRPYWRKYLAIPWLGAYLRQAFIRNVYHLTTIDDLKRSLFDLPVRFHGREVTGAWRPIERRAAAAVIGAARPPKTLTLRLRNAMVVPVDLDAEAAFLLEAIHIKLPRPLAALVDALGGTRLTRLFAGALSRGLDILSLPFVRYCERRTRAARAAFRK